MRCCRHEAQNFSGTAEKECVPSEEGCSLPGLAEHGLEPSRIAVAGDSVGANMAISLTLTAKERGDVTLAGQVLFYPVTDASFDTDSYRQFATGYREGMQWFWDQYTSDPDQRAEITASPLRATTEQLAGPGASHHRRGRRAPRRGRGHPGRHLPRDVLGTRS